jgi:hypothetical protein
MERTVGQSAASQTRPGLELETHPGLLEEALTIIRPTVLVLVMRHLLLSWRFVGVRDSRPAGAAGRSLDANLRNTELRFAVYSPRAEVVGVRIRLRGHSRLALTTLISAA